MRAKFLMVMPICRLSGAGSSLFERFPTAPAVVCDLSSLRDSHAQAIGVPPIEGLMQGAQPIKI
jgi:hypothetical protein